MKKKGKRSDTEIAVWQARLKASGLMFDRLRREREEFERALALSGGVRDWSAYRNISEAYADSVYGEQSVPLSFRYACWLQSQISGEPPVIRYPRNATGDETFAPVMEELLLRIWMESGSHREWRQTIFDLCGFGSSCVWYGFHADVIDLATVMGASEGVEGVIARMHQGDTAARPGNDSELIVSALEQEMGNQFNQAAGDVGTMMGMADVISEQIDNLSKEDKKKVHPAVQSREIWARRLRVGTDVRWSHNVTDLRDATWMARRVVMSMDEAKKFTGFNGGARQRLVARKPASGDGIETVIVDNNNDANEMENSRFVFWEVWDKENQCRHYISEDMDEYLESSEDYPYLDPRTNRPAIPGFFPCVVSAPMRHSMDRPERTAGIPLIESGYHIQREITKLHNFAMASVKRHSVRCYEVSDSLDDDAIADLTEGVDGSFIRRPPGVEPGGMVIPIQFSGEAYRIVELIGNLQAQWAAMVGIPLADLTSLPQAATATAESISVSAGRNQADHVFRSLEEDMGHAVEIIRAMLSIGLYPPEKIASLLGPGREDIVTQWSASSLEGDHIIVKSASRAKAEQSVRIKQLGDSLQLVMGYRDPKTGMPVYDSAPIIEEILIALDVGRPQRIQWNPQDLMAQMAMGGQQKGGEAPSGPSPSARAQGPTTPANEMAAAQRVRS